MPLKRLINRTTRDVLWVYILRLLLDREMYAYEIKKEIEKRFGFSPALITVYVVLYRLSHDGYVTVTEEGERKYYKITDKGRELLNQGIQHLRGIIKKLEE